MVWSPVPGAICFGTICWVLYSVTILCHFECVWYQMFVVFFQKKCLHLARLVERKPKESSAHSGNTPILAHADIWVCLSVDGRPKMVVLHVFVCQD